MASWKENGVVPDSDDEDYLDSQAIVGSVDRNTDQRNNGLQDYDDAIEIGKEQYGVEILDEERPLSEKFPVEEDIIYESKATPIPEVYESSNSYTDRRFQVPPSSSPTPLQGFKFPAAISDLDCESTDLANIFTQNVLSVEEISKSYVRLESQASSLLSSPPGSQQAVSSNTQSNTQSNASGDLGSHSPLKPQRQRPSKIAKPTPKDVTKNALQELAASNSRPLRHRNLIQLYPYNVEQEKYRRTLKARGMTPMRLTQAQDDDSRTSRDTTPQEPDSQGLGSQEMERETKESQLMNLDSDSEPCFPEHRPLPRCLDRSQNSDDSIVNDDDDDEFPDIDELLQGRKTALQQTESKHRKRLHSSTSKQLHLPRVQLQGTETTNLRGADSLSDVLASPPPTSSPFPTTVQTVRRSLSRAASVSSQDPRRSWLDHDDLRFQKPVDLLTPATSATKQISDNILLESDSDGEDPFASDLEETASSSLSDESIQIRKVGKRIRGVLPASHLRLNQQVKKPKAPTRTHTDAVSTSPAKPLARRGVALPKVHRNSVFLPPPNNYAIPFLSDDSDEGEEKDDEKGRIIEEDNDTELSSRFERHRTGFAEEDDKIDAMLPSRKRPSHFKTQPRKKRRVSSTSLSRKEGIRCARQPKFDGSLVGAHEPTFPKTYTNRQSWRPNSFRTLDQGSFETYRKPTPPRLSILDVTDNFDRADKLLPRFIKVAARTARSRIGQGRQSPSKKFIRLANREDTFEAQSVLHEWKEGKIIPKSLGRPLAGSIETETDSVHRIGENPQTRLRSPISTMKPRSQIASLGYRPLGMPRQLVISKGRQRSMNDFVSLEQPTPQQPQHSIAVPGPKPTPRITKRRSEMLRYDARKSRPAQLESSEVEYSRQNPNAAFKIVKKALDAPFWTNRKHPALQLNLQLNRFLADSDIVWPSIETGYTGGPSSLPETSKTQAAKSLARQRKRLPHRVDASAAKYRQSSEPLILEYLAPLQVQDAAHLDNKLLGLGKFGTRYPTHFDILPLQSGIYFHESTFIGSGRLSEAIKSSGAALSSVAHPHTFFHLGDKDFQWGQWNEDVSSEIGQCFDYVLEKLVHHPPVMSSSDPDPVRLITFVIDYVQHHLSFASSHSRCGFLSRMLEVLQEFSSHADIKTGAERKQAQQGIESLARCLVLVMQLLHISRAEQFSETYQLEDLLKGLAYRCVRLLVYRGLDDMRKLYDDLQYLSFRESGIKSDQYAAQAWVIVLRVLDTVRIPGGSFWDITNSLLADVDMNTVYDARIMEKIWYSIFSLLPLCEFDDVGVIIPGLREKASFDNWSLPQRILKRVFALYSSNARQSPSFNDYCRATVSRCHILMLEWGWWKCSGVIGTLFDFFASQNLAHLRNEEVYKSPHFLEELDKEPSLDVEPEDRCFHVFLKAVALAIKKMHRVGDEKGIRNLVARLLPNHDRQYPKEEAIHQHELAALRNHHDLLCTLYWAAPPGQQPSLNLIQELVIADLSHKEACLINLRTWTNLARFIFTSSTTPKVFQPFINWQNVFFSQLLQQYLETDSEVRRQAELLPEPEGGSISEATLQHTIVSNRRSTMDALQAAINAIRCSIKIGKDANAVMWAFNDQLLSSILNRQICGTHNLHEDLIGNVLNALEDYMQRIDLLHPAVVTPKLTHCPVEADSQGSFDLENLEIERQMMIYRLDNIILPCLSAFVRQILESSLYQSNEPCFMEGLVLCWARLVSLVTEEKYNLQDFIISGPNAVFVRRQGCHRANKYWPLFLDQLLEYKEFECFNVAGLDLALEWMLAIARPPIYPYYEQRLTVRFYQKGHYLVKSTSALHHLESLSVEPWPNQILINAAINSMREILRNRDYSGFANSHTVLKREAQSHFASLLREVMELMQQQLESMIPCSAPHKSYVEFCQDVVKCIRSHAGDIRPVVDFFLRSSIYYWPKDDDPNLYAAGIVSYSLRLRDQPGKTSFELFHFLYSGWKNELVHSRLHNHIAFILKGMKHWEFTEFMLANFVPAALLVGFHSREGSILPETYLPALAKRIPQLLDRRIPEAATVFRHLINILRIIMNGISTRILDEGLEKAGVHPENRGIITIACQFWISILPVLREYVELHPAEISTMDEITGSLNCFARKAVQYFNGGVGEDWGIAQLSVIQGDYVDRFVTALQEDIENHWMVHMEDNCMRINGTKVSLVGGIPPLSEVLEVGMPYFMGEPPESWVCRPIPGSFPGPFESLF